ncbi:hypothetical protein H0H92_000908 [Tricholoma furcatifolium]|nr:hypothetical protein H0H92_000908 [Tricholoma furcatifolium]
MEQPPPSGSGSGNLAYSIARHHQHHQHSAGAGIPLNQHHHHHQQQPPPPLHFPADDLPLRSAHDHQRFELPDSSHSSPREPQAQVWYQSDPLASGSRNEQHDHEYQQRVNPHQPQPRHAVTVKQESLGAMTSSIPMQTGNDVASGSTNAVRPSIDDSMPTTSDFVKKLFKMLEDKSFQHVVSWGPQGDCFVVKDMNEFTKSILPRLFKHSNFASFVRQLNKYDFHKVKNTDDTMQFGEQSWTFRHPDFHADRRDALENIKRKVPAQRKQQQAAALAAVSSQHPHASSSTPHAPSHSREHRSSRHGHSRHHHGRSRSPTYSQYSRSASPAPHGGDAGTIAELQAQVAALQAQLRTREQRERALEERVRVLERAQGEMSQGLVSVQRGLAMQDRVMQNLVQGWVGVGGAGAQGGTPDGPKLSRLDPGLDPRPIEDNLGRGHPSSSSTSAALNANANANANASSSSSSNLNSNSAAGLATSPTAFLSRPQNQLYAPFLPSSGVDTAPQDVALASLVRVGEYSRQQQQQQHAQAGRRSESSERELDNRDARDEEEQDEPTEYVMPTPTSITAFAPPASAQDWAVGLGAAGAGAEHHEGLHVYTMGHLIPRVEEGWYGAGAGEGSSSSQAQGRDAQGGYGGSSARGYGAQQQQQHQTRRRSTTLPENASSSAIAGRSNNNVLRVRRSTFVPGWAVPPRVLLVDDDAVSRKLGTKFLQVFGCTIDLAVDGMGAVNKMNLEKYDLVLMDVVMPKMDGVHATSVIRQFDPMTPIISMTSNSKPHEIMTYYSHGMNDILPKPFTKEGLLDMLEKHLMHLKVFQQHMRLSNTSVPRPLGAPDDSSAAGDAFEAYTPGAVQSQAQTKTQTQSPVSQVRSTTTAAGPSTANPPPTSSSSSSSSKALDYPGFSISPPPLGFEAEADGRINPLVGIGLTDEQYTLMLQSLVDPEGLFGVTSSSGSGSGSGPGSTGLSGDAMMIGVGVSGGGGRREKREREEDEGTLRMVGVRMGMGGMGGMGMGSMGSGVDEREGKRSRFEVLK